MRAWHHRCKQRTVVSVQSVLSVCCENGGNQVTKLRHFVPCVIIYDCITCCCEISYDIPGVLCNFQTWAIKCGFTCISAKKWGEHWIRWGWLDGGSRAFLCFRLVVASSGSSWLSQVAVINQPPRWNRVSIRTMRLSASLNAIDNH